jgi:hypothetical protein
VKQNVAYFKLVYQHLPGGTYSEGQPIFDRVSNTSPQEKEGAFTNQLLLFGGNKFISVDGHTEGEAESFVTASGRHS